MRLRQRRQSISHRRRQGLRRCRGAGAQAHHAAGERKQVLDAVVHLSEEQPLLVFRSPALRDFAGDLGCADDLACRVSERRDRQGNVDQSPVLALADGVIVLDALAATNALQDRRLFVVPVLRDEQGDRLAERFFRSVAEQALGAHSSS